MVEAQERIWAWTYTGGWNRGEWTGQKAYSDSVEYVRADLVTISDAVAEREAEPVAWMWRTNWTGEKWHFAEKASFCPSDLERRIVHSVAPLYTSPPTSELEALRKRVAELEGERDVAAAAMVRNHQRAEAAEARVAELDKALEQIDNLDQAMGHELAEKHAFKAVAIARRVREGGKVDG